MTKDQEKNELAERMTRLEGVVSNLAATVQSIVDTQKQRSGSMVGNLVAVLSFGAVLVGGIFVTLSAKQDVLSLKSELEMVRYVQPVVVSAEQSKSDRAMIHDRVQDNATKLALLTGKVDTNYAAFNSAIAESEAQFRNVGNISNLRAEKTHQFLSLLWERVFGTKIPEENHQIQQHRELLPR